MGIFSSLTGLHGAVVGSQRFANSRTFAKNEENRARTMTWPIRERKEFYASVGPLVFLPFV